MNMAKVSLYSSLALIFLLPLFFLPTQLVPLGLAKIILIILAAILLLVVLLIEAVRRKSIALPRAYILWVALLLPAIYIVSALMSGHFAPSFFGYVLEPGTAASVVLLSVLFAASALIFDDRLKLIRGLTALFLSVFVLEIFMIVKIISGGSWLTLGTLPGMGNPLGSWMDLGVIFGLLAVLSSLALEMLPLAGLSRILVWLSYVLSAFLLCAANFGMAWMLVLGASIVLLVYFNTVERGETSRLRPGLWTAGLLTILSLLFVWNPNIGGATFSQRVSNFVNIASSDVRPNLNSTLTVVKSALAESPVLGSGPNSFDRDWSLYKPSGVNASPYWNVSFPFGFGFLPTQIAETGVLGLLGWALLLVALIALGIKALTKSVEARPDRFMLMATLLTALFLWISTFLYTPSLSILAFAFISAGLLVGALGAVGVIGHRRIAFDSMRLVNFASMLVVILLLAGTAVFAFSSLNKVLAGIHYERALASSNSGAGADTVEAELVKAVQTSPSDVYWGALSQVEISRANLALTDKSASDADRQKSFQTALSSSIAALQNAITLNPSYSNWSTLGNLYESLVPAPLSVTGAYDNALAAYQKAEKLNPESPEVSLLFARLELDMGHYEPARQYINEALTKKQDYADAYFLLAKLEAKENNLPAAIKNAETSAVLSPNNAGVLFELGLLKYSHKDYSGSAQALEQALTVIPNYANAKYYLGLSYYKLGRKGDAIKQFEDLASTNPGNSLIGSALANLKAGRDPLYQAAPGNAAPVSGQ